MYHGKEHRANGKRTENVHIQKKFGAENRSYHLWFLGGYTYYTIEVRRLFKKVQLFSLVHYVRRIREGFIHSMVSITVESTN